MTKFISFLIFNALLFTMLPLAKAQDHLFGYISPISSNIGDDIQAIAAKRFLPKNSIGIDRDLINQFEHGTQIKTIVSGWFMNVKNGGFWERFDAEPPAKSWPPSSAIDPLLISMHITKSCMSQVFSEEGIKYLKENGPVGARDFTTLNELQKRNIPSYFSGCLTLTLDNPFKERDDIVYVVDVYDEECIKYIKSHTKSKVVVMTHGRPILMLLNHEQRLKYTERLLDQYRKAKCVITTRVHVSLPCLAFETPVLYVGTSNEPRLSGLIEHLWHVTKDDLRIGKINYDFDHPPENLKTYLPIRENLIKTVQDWVEKNSNI